jgi:hypothetical protein
MQLIITKEDEYLELEDTVKIKANEFGVWFWEDFYSIDAKKVSKPVDFSIYTKVYKDFKGKIMTLHLDRELAINTNNVLLLK